MQVADIQAKPTHVVLGGTNEVTQFGITNDQAFFKILSSSLYSDQKRAVVREIICNAWDAHIAAGKGDIPIEITVDKNSMTVRDFGAGIPKHLMGPIYTVYGQSTKRHESESTGGFGLGCKAPFAYADTFYVDSCSGGTHTAYVLGFSSGKGEGCPTLHTLFDAPTEDTGLTVRVPLKAHDAPTFMDLVEDICTFGGYPAKVNGQLINTVDYSQAEDGFVLVTGDIFSKLLLSESTVFIKYGTVLYPITANKQFSPFLGHIEKFAIDLCSGYASHAVILLAEPNTVTVTPSRESLNFTNSTIATCRQLLQNFSEYIEKRKFLSNLHLRKEIIELSRELENYHWTKKANHGIFDNFIPYPKVPLFNHPKFKNKVIFNATDIFTALFYSRGYDSLRDNPTAVNRRNGHVKKHKLVDKHIQKLITYHSKQPKTAAWFSNMYVAFWTDVHKREHSRFRRLGLDIEKLSLFYNAFSHSTAVKYKEHKGIFTNSATMARNIWCRYRANLPGFLQKYIIVGNITNATPAYVSQLREKYPDLSLEHVYKYHTNLRDKNVDEIIEKLEKLGYTVFNMFEEFPSETTKNVKNAVSTNSSKTAHFSIKKGFPCLEDVLTNGMNSIYDPSIKKITEAEWAILAPTAHTKKHIEHSPGYAFDRWADNHDLSGDTLKYLIDKHGTTGAVVGNNTQLGILRKNGTLTVKEFITKKLHEAVNNNKLFNLYIYLDAVHTTRFDRGSFVIMQLVCNSEFAKQMGFNVSTKDQNDEFSSILHLYHLLKYCDQGAHPYQESVRANKSALFPEAAEYTAAIINLNKLPSWVKEMISNLPLDVIAKAQPGTMKKELAIFNQLLEF